MGSVPSYFGYTPIHLPHPHAHEHLYPQAYHPGPGGFPAGPPPGHSIAIPNVELCARLALLERDYQNSQAENAKKEAVIQYLLHSKVSDEPSDNKAADLRDEVLSLKERISELNEDGKQLRSQLQQALDIIFTLPTPITAGFAAQSAPTNDRDSSKTTNVDVVKTHDLIDLLDCVEGSADAKLSGEDTTLLDDYHNDVSSIGEEPAKTAADQSLSQSLSSDLRGDSSYIHHFVRDESNVNPHEDVKKAAPKAEYAVHSLKTVLSFPGRGSAPTASADFDGSSSENSSSPNGPASVSASFSASSVGHYSTEDSMKKVVSINSEDELSVALQQWNTVKAVSKAKSASKIPSGKVSKLLSSQAQRENTIGTHKSDVGPHEHTVPDIFKYGVRFDPDPSEHNIYRTITISGLPLDMTISTLLEKVRGGLVVDAKLLNIKEIAGSKTALITFFHEHSALAYEEYAESHPRLFNNPSVEVKTLSTPTWPLPISLRKAIEEHKHTRCLEVYNFPKHVSQEKFRNDIRICPQINSDRIEYMAKREDGVLELRFSSIDYAGQGFGMFTCFRDYKRCKAIFVQDPCAMPLETLDQGLDGQAKVSKEVSSKPEYVPTEEDTGRLTKVEWESEPEISRGRGLEVEQ